MIDSAKLGTPWQDDELDLIIADYFAMLDADITGEPYVKARHSAALMQQLGRSHRSVEFKHQNISAVLDELGLPWIPGYIPKSNYQNAIFDGVDRYLSGHPEVVGLSPKSHSLVAARAEIFVCPPPRAEAFKPFPEKLEKLIRKFDPVERDHKNRALGTAGEAFVVAIERQRLAQVGLGDLSRKVRWVANEDGDGAGYDVLSFGPDGHEVLIEVKTTNGTARTPFFLSKNECKVSLERPLEWRIYRVHLFATQPKIFVITPPLDEAVRLIPENWRASF